jgi:hypothetical protein
LGAGFGSLPLYAAYAIGAIWATGDTDPSFSPEEHEMNRLRMLKDAQVDKALRVIWYFLVGWCG